ncbi:MAG: TadE family protein [Candidatus Acidiferrales bacterium]
MNATARNGRSCTQRGQALLELALVTPLLLALALGVIEIGRYAYIAILVGNAAHAGAAYGAQSVATAADPNGIQTAAENDFRDNGQDVSNLDVDGGFGPLYAACTCDSQGSELPPQPSFCNPPPVGSNNTAGSCPSGERWVVVVSVEASGTFRSLFSYPGIPRRITVDRTATMRVSE